jgi:hypothetical protein
MGPTACLPKARCLRLEPYALKGACTVLRGGGEGNLTSLPDLDHPARPFWHLPLLLGPEAVPPSPGRWPTSPQRGRGARDERSDIHWLYVAQPITVRPFWGEGRGEGAGEMPTKPGGSLR